METEIIEPNSPAEKIEEFLDEIHSEAFRVAEEAREQAKLNEFYYLGRQDQFYSPTSKRVERFWAFDRIPYRQHNLIRAPVDTQVARILKDLPSATAKPTNPGAVSRNAAAIAADYIEYQEFELGIDNLNAKVALKGFLHGTAGYKIVYQPSVDAIRWRPVTIFDFLIDPRASFVEEAQWVTFFTHKEKHDAIDLARRAGADIDPSEIKTTRYKKSVGDVELDGVEIQEVWHLPTPRVPQGLYAKVVGGKLVEAKPYFYLLPSRDDPNRLEPWLPLVLWQAGPSPNDNIYGSTPVSDAVHVQRQYNENESLLQHLKRISCDLKLLGTKHELDQWRVGVNQFIETTTGAIRWMDPPRIHPIIFGEKEEARALVLDLIGVSGLVTGQINPKSGQSARSLAYVDELDSLKLTQTVRSFLDMIEAAWELDLKSAQVFLSDERLIALPRGDAFVTRTFRGADLHGVTVRIEPRRGLERYSDQKAFNRARLAQQGLADPKSAVEAAQSGHTTTAYEAVNEKIVKSELEQILEGGAEPGFEAEPEVALRVLQELELVAREQGENPQILEAIRLLQEGYGQRLQAQGPAPLPAVVPAR